MALTLLCVKDPPVQISSWLVFLTKKSSFVVIHKMRDLLYTCAKYHVSPTFFFSSLVQARICEIYHPHRDSSPAWGL